MNAIIRPELAELANRLRLRAALMPHRDRRPMLSCAEQYERASRVPTSSQLKAGDVVGRIVIVALVETSENGRIHLVRCLDCRESWCMRGAKLRRLWVWKGGTACRTCREAGQ